MSSTNSKAIWIEKIQTVENALNNAIITPDQAQTYLEAIKFELRKSDIFEWASYYFPDKFKCDFCEFHRYLHSIAEQPKTAILAPRGHAKTTISCFLIPIYFALNFPEKYRHFMNVQASTEKAVAVNMAIRLELESNELLRADYGDQTTTEKWTERQFVLKNGVIFTAVGSGQSIRGLNYRNTRPDYVICDDLYDEDCVWSPHQVRKINAWFWSSLYKAVASDRSSCVHIRGTSISNEDLMHQLANRARWESAKFQAVSDWDKGLTLWPQNANLSIENLRADREEMGSIIFEREMQNELRDDETAVIKMAWIKQTDHLPMTKPQAIEKMRIERLDEMPEHITLTICGIDPAEKTKEINDFTGKAVCHQTNHGNYYFVYLGSDKFTTEGNKGDTIALHSRYKLDRCFFETNKAYALFENLRNKTSIPLKEVVTSKDKIQRLESVSALFENSKIYFHTSIPPHLLNEAIDQLTVNTPAHDDLRDAIVLCLEKTMHKKGFLCA